MTVPSFFLECASVRRSTAKPLCLFFIPLSHCLSRNQNSCPVHTTPELGPLSPDHQAPEEFNFSRSPWLIINLLDVSSWQELLDEVEPAQHTAKPCSQPQLPALVSRWELLLNDTSSFEELGESWQNLMADSNERGQEAEESVGSESQENSELCEDMPPSHFHSIITYAAFLNSYMNVLLLFIPVGLITGALGAPGAAVFIFNFISLIQLAAVIDLATEDLESSAGAALGGLLSILANNPVEMIVRGFCSV